MLKLLFLFTEGSKFSLPFTKANLSSKLVEFHKFVNKTNSEAENGKQFASGKTALKFPTYRAMYIGLEIEGRIVTVLDLKNKAYRYKGRSLHNDLFPPYLEKQVLHILAGTEAMYVSESFDSNGTLEQPVILERIQNQERKERKLLAAANSCE